MIAIPNMSKPNDCYECPIAKSYLDCLMETKYTCPIGHTDDCPLIEIDDEVWENEKYKLIRMTEEQRVNKKLAERRADEHID